MSLFLSQEERLRREDKIIYVDNDPSVVSVRRLIRVRQQMDEFQALVAENLYTRDEEGDRIRAHIVIRHDHEMEVWFYAATSRLIANFFELTNECVVCKRDVAVDSHYHYEKLWRVHFDRTRARHCNKCREKYDADLEEETKRKEKERAEKREQR